MDDFVGRKRELAHLNEAYERRDGAFLPIYGRRRVGKSELILQFLRGKRGIYFLGKRAPAELQIRELLTEAAIVLEEPLLAALQAEGWQAALSAIVSRWRGPQKLVLALDEFQWLAGASPELPSVLQHLWDREWKKSGRVMLILCGSYMGFMEKEVLGRGSPLFGRRTAQILLQPFDYREAAAFHPRYSLVDRARVYFLCGGIPFYLRFFSDRKSIESNLAEQMLAEHAALFREGDFLLREELREVESYYAVLLAVAGGDTSHQAISRRTSINARNLNYYLQQLVDLGYIARRFPLTGEPANPRDVRFELGDPLLRFWFRFVFPNMSYVLRVGPEKALRDRIRPHLDAYFGGCFEGLCREALPHLYDAEGVRASFEIGEYWSRSAQIDVVGLRDDGWTDLGECKWGTVRSTATVERELEERVLTYPNRRQATLGRRVFVRQRPRGRSPGDRVRWHDLEEIYA